MGIELALYHILLNVVSVNLASYFVKKIDGNGEEIPHLTATHSKSLRACNVPISLLSPISLVLKDKMPFPP